MDSLDIPGDGESDVLASPAPEPSVKVIAASLVLIAGFTGYLAFSQFQDDRRQAREDADAEVAAAIRRIDAAWCRSVRARVAAGEIRVTGPGPAADCFR